MYIRRHELQLCLYYNVYRNIEAFSLADIRTGMMLSKYLWTNDYETLKTCVFSYHWTLTVLLGLLVVQ